MICWLEPEIEAPLDRFERRAGQLLVGKHIDPRIEQLVASGNLADRLAEPADQPVVRQNKGLVDRFMDAGGAALDLACQRLLGGGIEGFGGLAGSLGVEAEAEAGQMSDMLALDHYVAAGGDFRFQHSVLS